ncbi:MAG: FKBP-type peptidyl-prolyl cis-trans isomerase [Actinomycetota bacterium]|nr:FKBP-type peptidyl-prolyl cis-trans isomerase [Actinomycetota bacterium]
MPRNIVKILSAATACILLLGCGNDGGESAATDSSTEIPTSIEIVPTPTPAGDVDNADLSVKPLVIIPSSSPPTELLIEDLVVGSGSPVGVGDFLVMDYVGVSYSTGLQFDASWDRGSPFPFELGAGRVIQGWDQGIVGMSVGGRRSLTIPPELAYGENGSGSGSIGPNETLVFVVDLIASVPANLEKPTEELTAESTTELETNDISQGSGAIVQPGNAVYIHYVGVSASTGEQFDSSWDRGRSEFIGYISGTGNVIQGLDEGLLGMQVGGRRTVVIPPDLAYGQNGAGDGLIAPNETLVFTVDLLGPHPLRGLSRNS